MADLYGFHVGKYSSPMDGMVDDPEESKSTWMSQEISQNPWTPKPWKMKVLHPQNMGYNP